MPPKKRGRSTSAVSKTATVTPSRSTSRKPGQKEEETDVSLVSASPAPRAPPPTPVRVEEDRQKSKTSVRAVSATHTETGSKSASKHGTSPAPGNSVTPTKAKSTSAPPAAAAAASAGRSPSKGETIERKKTKVSTSPEARKTSPSTSAVSPDKRQKKASRQSSATAASSSPSMKRMTNPKAVTVLPGQPLEEEEEAGQQLQEETPVVEDEEAGDAQPLMAAPSPLVLRAGTEALEQLLLRSKTIAPEVSGIRCIAHNKREDEICVARENGSLVLYQLHYHQNIPHFNMLRHTGGSLKHTITRLQYVDVATLLGLTTVAAAAAAAAAPADGAGERKQKKARQETTADLREDATSATNVAKLDPSLPHSLIVASYLSSQLVVYDAETLFPLLVHPLSGGAVWDLAVCEAPPHSAPGSGCLLFTAMADGTWQQLRLTLGRHRSGYRPQIELERIIPAITGADRALRVSCNPALELVVGTNDSGYVHAWRLAAETERKAGEGGNSSGGGRGLAAHQTLWSTRLPKGIALSCAVAAHTSRPAVAVGTSLGDVVLLDALSGQIFATFSQHRGPVTTLISHQQVFYASGWHESLRCYRCDAEGEWRPAEVKRRTHYHEASELLLLPRTELLLSAARDGTVLYSPASQVFHTPAMYLPVTTQPTAFAKEKNALLLVRQGRIECFRVGTTTAPSATSVGWTHHHTHQHWLPLFGYAISGNYHVRTLWCDPQLHYLVWSTDERVVLARVQWQTGKALRVSRIEEVLELPARRGLVHVCYVPPASPRTDANKKKEEEKENEEEEEVDHGRVYLVFDDEIVFLSLRQAVTPVRIALPFSTIGSEVHHSGGGSSDTAASATHASHVTRKLNIRVMNAFFDRAGSALRVFGLHGQYVVPLLVDGTPDDAPSAAPATTDHATAAASAVAVPDSTVRFIAAPLYHFVQEVPTLAAGTTSSGTHLEEEEQEAVLVGLSVQEGYYVADLLQQEEAQQSSQKTRATRTSVRALPASLPHDAHFVARYANSANGTMNYVASFSKGVLHVALAGGAAAAASDAEAGKPMKKKDGWYMAARTSVEGAFVLQGDRRVLLLERNLERVLESLPLCWKVRRFGN